MRKTHEATGADKQTADDAEAEPEEKESGGDDEDSNEGKRFERPDNLRRRSEWFQKRTGGR